jgi:hypothetical protein
MAADAVVVRAASGRPPKAASREQQRHQQDARQGTDQLRRVAAHVAQDVRDFHVSAVHHRLL